MDNFLGGANSLEACVELYKQGIKIFSDAGMWLRQWGSSHQKFTAQVEEKDRASDQNHCSALGLHWDMVKDELSIAQVKNVIVPVTKRDVLKLVSSYFDVFGICNPVLLGPKLFIQDTWKVKLHWDEPMSEELQQKFQDFIPDLKKLSEFRIPRWIQMPPVGRFSLVTFTDASKVAYAANVYLSHLNEEGCFLNLLISKMRLSPIVETTIPRLELLGVFIGTKLMAYVQQLLEKPIEEMIRSRSSSQSLKSRI